MYLSHYNRPKTGLNDPSSTFSTINNHITYNVKLKRFKSITVIVLCGPPSSFITLSPKFIPSVCVHLSCTCTPSLHHHSFILCFPTSLPCPDSPSFPILLSLFLLLVSLIYRRRCAVHTHSPSDTTPPTPPLDSHIYARSFIFMILKWREEEEGGLER